MKQVYIIVFGLIIIIVKEFTNVSAARIKLIHYDSNNLDIPKELNYSNINLINMNIPIKVIVHGWNASADVEWYDTIKDEYLIYDDFNVILVDWSDFAMRDYYVAAKCVEYVGNSLGEVLHYFYTKINLPLDNVHMICHSLGAHVCGQAGRTIKKLTGKKIKRITALDPSALFFEFQSIFQPISNTNAMVVDVIHTDGGIFGYSQPIGTIDFFPNGGQRPLPECPSLFNEEVDFNKFVWCNHMESISYFIDSINNITFISSQCDSWHNYVSGVCDHNQRAIMGEDLSYETGDSGIYFLTTF